ncbi:MULTISPECIES: hypothetical protein [Haloferacaceae]|uniref:Uncharacterized protein n=1 Tax=Halorubrum glutamatedens TaxID=2707018 RepID=A0ABD5QU21_9EURY|nr:hypothetical protein [Halobellus captivus]
MSIDPVEAITSHCAGRMVDRTSGELVSAAVAYERGVTVDIPQRAPVPPHDEAVFDEWTDTVVFRRGRMLVTVYGLSPAHITSIHGVAVAAAVDEQCETEYCAEIDPRNLELI